MTGLYSGRIILSLGRVSFELDPFELNPSARESEGLANDWRFRVFLEDVTGSSLLEISAVLGERCGTDLLAGGSPRSPIDQSLLHEVLLAVVLNPRRMMFQLFLRTERCWSQGLGAGQ